MSDVKFEIVEAIGVLSTASNGWKKELNRVSWNDSDPKMDIRSWSPDHTKMSKGITMTEQEINSLKNML